MYLKLSLNNCVYLFQAKTQSKTHTKDAKKNFSIMQISTLTTSLREALGGFACPSGQAGVKKTLKFEYLICVSFKEIFGEPKINHLQ